MDYTLTKKIGELREEIKQLKEINSDMYKILKWISQDTGLIGFISRKQRDKIRKILSKAEGKDASKSI